MSNRPDIATRLVEEEDLLWQGHPTPGRKTSRQALTRALLLGLLSLVLFLAAMALALFKGNLQVWLLTSYGLIATAAFLTYLALRMTLLDTRRARARDARTSYGITTSRALTLSGPYAAELALEPAMRTEIEGDRLTIFSGADSLRFDRLDDAPTARDILLRQIGGTR